MAAGIISGDGQKVAQQIIVHWPIHQADVALIAASNKLLLVQNPAVTPQTRESQAIFSMWIETVLHRFQSARVASPPAQQWAGPSRSSGGTVRTPKIIPAWPFDYVICARKVFDRQADRERLRICELHFLRGMRLTGLRM